jgi:hypothetical protein
VRADLPLEQLLQVDLVFLSFAQLLHLHVKLILDLTGILNEVALPAKSPVANEDAEDVLLHSRAPRKRLVCIFSEGLEGASEKLIRITLAFSELLHRKETVTRGPSQRSLQIWPVALHGESGSLGGESAHGTVVAVARTALLHVREDNLPNRLHAKEHLRDRVHEARIAQVANAPSTAAPLQLTQHLLAGNSVSLRAEVTARRQRSQLLRHVARVASGRHASHLVPPCQSSPGRASATPSTAPATRRPTRGRRRICGPRRVAAAAAAPAPPRRPCVVRRNECPRHRHFHLARAQRVRGQRRLHSRRRGRLPVRRSCSDVVVVVVARLLTDAR